MHAILPTLHEICFEAAWLCLPVCLMFAWGDGAYIRLCPAGHACCMTHLHPAHAEMADDEDKDTQTLLIH